MQTKVITLQNNKLSVDICPTLGAEIRRIGRTGIAENFLMQTNWVKPGKNFCKCNEISEAHFLSHYVGGWQLMLPNVGFTSFSGDVELGYHGEAWHSLWDVKKSSPIFLELQTNLYSIPLSVNRKISLVGSALIVTDEVTNLSPQRIEFLWGHHPAFSDLLIDSSSEVRIKAKVLSTARSTLSNASSDTPPVFVTYDKDIILSNIWKEPYSYLGYISEFESGQASIINHNKQLQLVLSWDLSVFPFAWLWIENMQISEDPWRNKIRTLAIEPCSTTTNMGLLASKKSSGNTITLGTHESKQTQIRVEVSTLNIEKGETIEACA